jgi:hypothetical protein
VEYTAAKTLGNLAIEVRAHQENRLTGESDAGAAGRAHAGHLERPGGLPCSMAGTRRSLVSVARPWEHGPEDARISGAVPPHELANLVPVKSD